MDKIISATQARIHFGEVMQAAQTSPVIVEKDGVPKIVILSKQKYDELTRASAAHGWRELVRQAHARVREDLAGKSLPQAGDVIRQIREERDEQLNGLR
jgi:prevent-host-death family protein